MYFALIIALVMHEAAHGFASMILGDPTPGKLGRITLNPLKHLDPLGTIFPALMILTGSPFIFGWAKPVPVNPTYYKYPRKGFAIVAAAGPLVNFVLALIAAFLFRLLGEGLPNVIGVFLILQIVLGILTILNGAQIYIASMHQITSIFLVSSCIYLLFINRKTSLQL